MSETSVSQATNNSCTGTFTRSKLLEDKQGICQFLQAVHFYSANLLQHR